MNTKQEDKKLIETFQDSEDIFQGTLLHVKRDTVLLPNGKTATREWICHPGASAVVPLLSNGDIIFVRQYRHPIGEITLELPAGKLDVAEEDPLACAKRELSEETGFTAEHFSHLTTIATTVGFSNERIHIYLAQGLKAGAQHTDADEFINVVRISLSEAVQMIKDGRIVDAKSIVGILMTAESKYGRAYV